MGIWDKLTGELIDIIEWLDSSNDTLVYRFERHGNEIKYGAKLVVREGQAAVFVNEGQIADVFTPGTYELVTKNIPILTTLKGWKYGFESPFKAEVYFVSTRKFTDQKWGTKNPIMLRDPEFGPVRLRAFGTYVFRAKDPAELLREIVGTDGHFTTDEITEQLRNILVTRFADAVAESKIPVLDLAASYNELGDLLRGNIDPEFQKYGVELTKLLVENISLPQAVEEALDKRTSMGVIGNLGAYTQFQAANAMEKAAENEGAAGGGMGMGMGMLMGGQMGNMAGQAAQNPQQMTPPPPPPPTAARVYNVAVNGQTTGPFDVTALQGQVAAGAFTPESMVWTAGMAGWLPASQVPELLGLFQQAPPPPPPAPGTPPPPPPAS